MDRVVVQGGGGHAKVVIDILDAAGLVEIAGFVSAGFVGTGAERPSLCRYSCLGTDVDLDALFQSGIRFAFVAIGDNRRRTDCQSDLLSRGFGLVNAISPRASVSRFATLGQGVAVMPGAVINAGARIGDGVIVNTNATVDHDCQIGDFVHVAPGTILAGCVSVGEGTLLGAGSCAIPGVRIGCWTTIGAGATVVGDIPERVLAVGVPATVREVKR